MDIAIKLVYGSNKREKTKYVPILKAGLRAISLFPFVSLTPGDISTSVGCASLSELSIHEILPSNEMTTSVKYLEKVVFDVRNIYFHQLTL